MLCGFNPQAPADDTLLVGRVTDAMGCIRATLVNYACHPTTLGPENRAISPDYIGAMRETIQQATGAPAIFLQGASGDLAPRYQYVADPGVADAHGRQLGFAALATLNGMEPPGVELRFAKPIHSGAELAYWRRAPRKSSQTLEALETHVELPVKEWFSAADLEQQYVSATDRVEKERLRRRRTVLESLGGRSTFRLPVTTWRIGDAVLVGSCCESYSILQQRLRRQFSHSTIVCMNLINGSIGYLPPAELYDTITYTVWQTPFDAGSLEAVIDAMAAAIESVSCRQLEAAPCEGVPG